MASSKATAAIALLVSLNLIFFSMTTEATTYDGCGGRDCSVCEKALANGNIPSKGSPCCALLQDLVNLKLDLCLCSIVKANILGGLLTLAADLQLNLLLGYCGCPYGYKC